jgi:hypothetical protein
MEVHIHFHQIMVVLVVVKAVVLVEVPVQEQQDKETQVVPELALVIGTLVVEEVKVHQVEMVYLEQEVVTEEQA